MSCIDTFGKPTAKRPLAIGPLATLKCAMILLGTPLTPMAHNPVSVVPDVVKPLPTPAPLPSTRQPIRRLRR